MGDLAEWCDEFAAYLEASDFADGIHWESAADMRRDIDNFRAVAMRLRAFGAPPPRAEG